MSWWMIYCGYADDVFLHRRAKAAGIPVREG